MIKPIRGKVWTHDHGVLADGAACLMVDALAALAAEQEPCVWRLESGLDYTSGCGMFNAIHTGGSFCGYCGHPLKIDVRHP